MKVLVLLALAVTIAACGTEGHREPGLMPTLSGDYVVTAVTDGGQPHAVVRGTEIRLSFADGNLDLQAGCNRMSAAYTIDGSRLTVGPVASTEMGCPQPRMAQDTWLAGLFARPATIDWQQQTITAGDVVLTLRPRTAVHPDQDLRRTRWVLDGVTRGEVAGSVPAGPEVALVLEGTDVAHVSGLCNGFGADIEVADGVIRWMPHMRTLMACADPDRQALDDTVSRVLTGRTSYRVTEKTLVITHGEVALTFRAG
ncbi:META domain-containing protein [Nocardioides jiangxiensis]|uniref:META domain-containing protein n=1 Tax=Nocardioides jiangxiensis TaxID=3064524 RepID=A0ABT9B2Y0_9ACTN|nr:META domain-containing protein [Nocardioides sp. WY-20]MDO7869210.1 META domain-containing protein [Nocardioides sp. WY-20]